MDTTAFPLMDVLRVRALPEHVLWAHFSGGHEGTLDMSEMIATGGSMLQPLADQDFFARVFVEAGVPVWPNHFDMDATYLYIQMRKAGTLKERMTAAE